MNNLIMYFLILLNFGCGTSGSALIDSQSLQRVEVNNVSLQITTSITVKCNDFESYFAKSDMYLRTLTNSSQWNALIREINRVVAKDEKFDESADVRMKVNLYYDNNNVVTICIGNTLTSINENNYVNDDAFREFIIENFEK